MNYLVSVPGTTMSDFQITHLVSDRDNTVLNNFTAKDLNGGFYLKQISNNNVIDFDNKLYKARVVIKNNNI